MPSEGGWVPPGKPAQSSRPRRITRRAVLGGALTVGIGAGVLKLVVGQPSLDFLASRSSRPSWRSPLGSEPARLAHLLRRATLGAGPQALERALEGSFTGTVDRILETPAAEPLPLISSDDLTHGGMLSGPDLQQWWLKHILTTPTPFAERMTYFWHGHFTSDVDKVGNPFMYWQNLTWRRMALGRLPDILWQVTVDPAMLLYLDLDSSDASDHSQPPNENYARELMELFTMGPGNYSEADVKAGARALAGWSAPPPDGEVEVVVDPETGTRAPVEVWSHQTTGVFYPEKAYDGKVAYLGKKGRLQLSDVIKGILAQPVTGTFLARKVAAHFISPKPSDETIRQLAGTFRSTGYDVRALVRAALLSPEFVAAGSYRSLVKSPVEFMLSAALAVGASAQDAAELIAGYGYASGQSLFEPPNVAGWPGNERWISPSMVLARFNFVSELLDRVGEPPSASGAEELHLDGVVSDSTARRLSQTRSDRERWLVILTSPEFNLK